MPVSTGVRAALGVPILRACRAVSSGTKCVGSGILRVVCRASSEAVMAPVLATVKLAESVSRAVVHVGGQQVIGAVHVAGTVVGTLGPICVVAIGAKVVVGRLARHTLMTVLKDDMGSAVKEVGRSVDWGQVVATQSAISYPVGHSHASEAAIRLEADRLATHLADQLGVPRWDTSICRRTSSTKSETGFKVQGQRFCYNAADLAAEYKNASIPDNALISIIDQDWFYEQKDFDRFVGHPIVMFTFFLNGVAGRRPGSSWVMRPDNTMKYKVDGGREYLHRLHDWRRDDVLLSGPFSAVLYNIVHIKCAQDPTRGLVLLCPSVRFRVGGWVLHGLGALGGFDWPRVERQGGVKVWGDEGARVVGALVETPGHDAQVSLRWDECDDGTSVNVSLNAWCSLRARALAEMKGGKPQLPYYFLQTHAKSFGLGESMADFTLVSAALGSTHAPFFSNRFIPVVVNEEIVATKEHRSVPCCVAPGVASANPKIDAYLAAKALLDNRNYAELPQGDLLDNMLDIVVEYTAELLTGGFKFPALDVDDVRARQIRKPQRERNDVLWRDGVNRTPDLMIKWNPKGETLDKAKTRLIALCPTDHTIQCSRFATVLEALAKDNLPGWAVGKAPRERALLLRELYVETGGSPVETDYTTMDALITVYLRKKISDRLAAAPFEGTELDELRLLQELEHSVAIYARSPSGKSIWGNSSGCNISGSRWVGFINTIINYVLAKTAAWRAELIDMKFAMLQSEWDKGGALASPTAMKALDGVMERVTCVVGGDDGCMGLAASESLIYITERLGLKIKVQVPRDGRLTFFSRVYTNLPMHLASYPVIDRALGKLATARMGDAGFGAKWRGALAADPVTPLISDYAQALLRVYPSEKVVEDDKEYQIKTTEGAHPDAGEHTEELVDFMAADMGISAAWVHDAIARYRAAKTPFDLAAIKLRIEPRVMKIASAWI